MGPWASVARANFLLLPVVLVAVGATAAGYEGTVRAGRTLAALLGLVAAHVAVNVFNELSDYRRGIDLRTTRTPFSGGSGTLPSGRLEPVQARRLGLAAAAVALAVGLWFLAIVGWALLPILLVGATATFGYSELLSRVWVGELFAGLGLGALPVLGTALVQDGSLGAVAVWASVPAFLMTFNLLLLNEFPDEAADAAGGRRNLVLLLGRSAAARLYVAAGTLAPVWLVLGVTAGRLPAWALAAAVPSLALIPPCRWALSRPHRPVPVPALGANVVWNLATNLVLALALAAAGLIG